MRRSDLHRALERATGSHRVTLVKGLPRVGRSDLLKRWAHGRDDTVNAPFPGEGDHPASVVIFDHLRREDVPTFVAHVRAVEAAGAPTRFVVAPVDLGAAEDVLTALAGSVLTLDVAPLQIDEILAERAALSVAVGPEPGLVAEPVASNTPPFDAEKLWLRGGLPESVSADSDTASLTWRREMIGGLLARDYTSWGVLRTAPLERILRWIASRHGAELDEAGCPGVPKAELKPVLFVFEKLAIIRRLSNYPVGHRSSLGKSPKIYVRDTGILHALLGIETILQLRRSPSVGNSFEGYAIDSLIEAVGDAAKAQFYRAKGADAEEEIDLVLDFGPRIKRIVAIECKTNPNAPPRKGFYQAREKIEATDAFVVHSGPASVEDVPVERLDLLTALGRLTEIGRS